MDPKNKSAYTIHVTTIPKDTANMLCLMKNEQGQPMDQSGFDSFYAVRYSQHSAMNSDTIGLYNVDAVITTGKSEIQAAIKEKVIRRLDKEDIGLQLANITIQDAEPPTSEVQRAFTAVETAKQSADTTVNNAKKYANEVIPAAAADADQIIKSAEAYRQSKINEAEGQAARFAALFEEYQKYPLITKQRLFYEAMEKVLPGMKLYIVDANTGVQTALPLEPFANVDLGGGNGT